MTLKEFLEYLAESIPFTVGTKDGERWVVYHDGEHERAVPDWIADRQIVNIYPMEGREKTSVHGVGACRALKAGLAVIVEGSEDGSI